MMKIAWPAAVVLIACSLSGAGRAEIQTLFRGQCLSEAEAAEKLRQFAAEYDNAHEWQARAERIRDGLLRGMKLEQLPPKCALNPIRHSVRQEDGYTVENVAFESLPGFWVTGNLYLPAENGARASDGRRAVPARTLGRQPHA